MRVSIA
jgi:hypothetical protein